MKAFFVKYRRLVLLAVPLILYMLHSITLKYLMENNRFSSTKTLLDQYIPFLDFAIYGYVLWVILATVSLFFLFSCLGDGYYRLIIAMVLSVSICIAVYIYFPVKMDIPDFGNSAFLDAVLKNRDIASFPNLPSGILFNSFFFSVFHKKKHDHSKCSLITLLFGLILAVWIVCALLSKMAYVLDVSSGIFTGMVSSLIISLIPFKQTH